MKRGKPLKRTGFKARVIERSERKLYRLARPCGATVIGEASVPVPKAQIVRSETYRRLVASLACINCGIEGFSQHAHGNQGKGMAMKTDDRFAFPLCAPRPGEAGCHAKLDQGALFPKQIRREVEQEWARRTVRFLIIAGLYPETMAVPDWANE